MDKISQWLYRAEREDLTDLIFHLCDKNDAVKELISRYIEDNK